MTTGGSDGLSSDRLRVVRGATVVVVVVVVMRDVRESGLRRVVICTERCVVDGAFARPENAGRRPSSGFARRREFSVVVVTGSWLSLSTSSEGSSVTKVVSNSSGSGVVCVAWLAVPGRVEDGRMRLRLIDGRAELDAILGLTTSELRNAGRRAPPSAEVGWIRGVSDVLEGRMLDVGWMLARTLVGRTKLLRELLPPNDVDDELGLKAETDPLDRRGALNGLLLDASAVFTAVALIVGVISVGVMIDAPLVELFFFGLNVGRDLELPNGLMTGVKPFLPPGNLDFGSSSSPPADDSDPSSTAGVGLINCDVGDTTPTAAVGSMLTRLSTADASIDLARITLDVLSMTCA